MTVLSNLLAVVAAIHLAAPPQGAGGSWRPTSKWVVDFADEQCAASRDFASEAGSLTVTLVPSPMRDEVKVLLEGSSEAVVMAEKAPAVLIGDAPKDVAATFRQGRSNRPGRNIYAFPLAPADYAELADGKPLKLQSKSISVELTLDRLGEIRKLLDTCMADLLVHWGLSMEDQGRLASFPEIAGGGKRRPIFRSGDYPDLAVRNMVSGTTSVVLAVDASGKPRGCRVVETSGDRMLDQRSCSVIMGRGRFDPARDRAGQPMAAPYYMSISWVVR